MPPSSCRSPASTQFANLKDGQAVFVARPNGARVIHLVELAQPAGQPAAATPAIEQYLLNERKRKLVADDLRALRGAAKIEYVGDYAGEQAAAAADAACRRTSR